MAERLGHFSFAGMQRCGNHAIINWWMGHFNGYYFRNNILGLTCKHKAAQVSHKGDYTEQIRIDSWENYDPRTLQISNNSEPLAIIVRDPYNWWASWFQYHIPNPNVHYIARADTIQWYLKYIEYARAFPKSTIIFNRWFDSTQYRRQLEQDWNLGFSDATLHEIPKFGSGSTFDQQRYDGKAQEMGVLRRYEKFVSLPAYYQPLRQHPELADIAREIFALEPPRGIHES